MGITANQTCEKRGKKTRECVQWIASECAEQQIEPHYVGFQFPQRAQKSNRTCRMIERPTAKHGKTIEFRLGRRELIGKNRKTEKGIAA